MGDYVKIASTSDVKTGTGVTAEINGHTIALFNVEGTFYAIDNTCVHRGGPLGEGDLEGDVVTCPWHSWRFNVKSGMSVNNPSACVKTYSVKVDGDDVKVLL
jgi:NAD(P)H-dependent nitrite reductase small subunit